MGGAAGLSLCGGVHMAIIVWCTSGLSLCGGTHLACYCVVVYMSHVIVWQCTSGLPVFGCVYLACCEMVCIRPVTAQWYTGGMLLYDSVQVVCYVWWCTCIRCHWWCADGVFVEQCAGSLLLCGGVQVLGITMWWCAGTRCRGVQVPGVEVCR